MKNLGMLLAQVGIVVAALAIYHVIFHMDAPPSQPARTDDLTGGGLNERMEIEHALEGADSGLSEAYDEQAMRKIVERAEVELTSEQAARLLPLMHTHLAALRRNLAEARDAVVAGRSDAQRVRYRVRAVRLHADFQKTLRKTVSKEQAEALFRAMPSMIPPVPGATNPPPPPPVKPEAPIRIDNTPDGR